MLTSLPRMNSADCSSRDGATRDISDRRQQKEQISVLSAVRLGRGFLKLPVQP